jgi:hypothetical protein
MARAHDDQTLEKTEDLLARSRQLLQQLDRRIAHGDGDLDGHQSKVGVQSGHSEDSEEPYQPPRRPK